MSFSSTFVKIFFTAVLSAAIVTKGGGVLLNSAISEAPYGIDHNCAFDS